MCTLVNPFQYEEAIFADFCDFLTYFGPLGPAASTGVESKAESKAQTSGATLHADTDGTLVGDSGLLRYDTSLWSSTTCCR